MSIDITYHAQLAAQERGITNREISRALRIGKKSTGKGNKTILTDEINNVAVVVVGLSKRHWLVITTYRPEY